MVDKRSKKFLQGVKMKKIVLFDMDGTLTPARKAMEPTVLASLKKLHNAGYEIGIVTGSGMNYIKEQCVIMFEDFNFDHNKLYYFPHNGTKYIRYESNLENILYDMSMKKEIGETRYREIIYHLIENQLRIKRKLYGSKIPLTGNFIDCRGSMINWCPIGRNANHDDRAAWKILDLKHKIRESLLDAHFRDPVYECVEVKLGGSTSFDIYPKGWDKSFVLSNFNQEDDIWFIGDKCQLHGNDKELYDAIRLKNSDRSFKTNNPAQTIDIINTILKG